MLKDGICSTITTWLERDDLLYLCPDCIDNIPVELPFSRLPTTVHFKPKRDLRSTKREIHNEAVHSYDKLLNIKGWLPKDNLLHSLKADNLTNIQFGMKLGSGGYGTIFKGVWNSMPVAIKEIKNTESLRTEVEVLSACKHKNIISFYGVCALPDSTLCLVLEFCELGSLYNWIFTDKKDLDIQNIVNIAISTAIGMDLVVSMLIFDRNGLSSDWAS